MASNFRTTQLAIYLVPLLAVFLAMTEPLDAQHLPWSKSLETALERAKSENRPVLICMHWSKETASVQMLKKHYRNPEIIRAMKDFVLVGASPDRHKEITIGTGEDAPKVSALFGAVNCEVLRKTLHEVQGAYFETPDVTVPQHIFVSPKGEILLRKKYLLNEKAFMKLLAEGMAMFTNEAVGGFDASMKEHFQVIVKERSALKRAAVRAVLEVESARTHEILFHVIDGLKRGKDREVCIRAMGRESLDTAVPLLKRWLSDDNQRIVNCAVVSLEEVQANGVVGELLALWKSTKNRELKKDLLRAFGPCGEGREDIQKLVAAQLNHRKEEMRRAAYLSIGYFLDEEDDALVKALQKRWKKEGRGFLARAAILMAFGRGGNSEHAPIVDKLVVREKNHQLKTLAASIAKALREGGDATSYGGLMADLTAKDKFKRN